jgi:hypothetical protein
MIYTEDLVGRREEKRNAIQRLTTGRCDDEMRLSVFSLDLLEGVETC